MNLPWTEPVLERAHAITSRSRPYLYLASRWFDDPLRRAAFEVAYASMRGVDDSVDGAPAPHDRAALGRLLQAWIDSVRRAHAGRAVSGDWVSEALAVLFKSYALPMEPWDAMARALSGDLARDGFEDLEEFFRYADGAAVGPARLFAMLATAAPAAGTSGPQVPHSMASGPEIRKLAHFTYLVHGLRDLAEDLAGPARGSALRPRAELRAAGLEPDSLECAPAGARRNWVHGIAERARALRREAGNPWLQPGVPARAAAVLDFLVSLYECQLDRMEAAGWELFEGAHRMEAVEVLAVAGRCAVRGEVPPDWRERLERELNQIQVPRA